MSDMEGHHEQSSPWFFSTGKGLERFSVEDFLPSSYLSELNAAGYHPTLKITFKIAEDGARQGTLEILDEKVYETSMGALIVHFSFWVGRASDSIIIEHLMLQNPLNEGEGRTTQYFKGLPLEVSLELKNNIYSFLVNGGFKNLEVRSSQNYLVGALYRKVLVPPQFNFFRFCSWISWDSLSSKRVCFYPQLPTQILPPFQSHMPVQSVLE